MQRPGRKEARKQNIGHFSLLFCSLGRRKRIFFTFNARDVAVDFCHQLVSRGHVEALRLACGGQFDFLDHVRNLERVGHMEINELLPEFGRTVPPTARNSGCAPGARNGLLNFKSMQMPKKKKKKPPFSIPSQPIVETI